MDPNGPARLALPLVALLAASLPAQVQFTELRRQHLPRVHEEASSVAVGDLDGDGALDAVIGNFGRPDEVWLGDDVGGFRDVSATSLPSSLRATDEVHLGDLDGDGDLDLVALNARERQLYLNDGSGLLLEEVGRIPGPVSNYTLGQSALLDVDGDADLDLVFATSRQNELVLNDGSGNFTDVTASQMPAESDRSFALTYGDFDADGDIDLLFANRGPAGLFVNDGSGRFSVSPGVFPAEPSPGLGVAAGDVDGDGDLDVVISGRSGGALPAEGRLFLNDGHAGFSVVRSELIRTAAFWSPHFLDFDGDGALDLLTFDEAWEPRLLRNRGRGHFEDASSRFLGREVTSAFRLAVADVDEDGDLDVLVPSTQNSKLYLNDGRGFFADGMARYQPPDSGSAGALGDLDGDGSLDLVIGFFGGVATYRNDRFRGMGQRSLLNERPFLPGDVSLVDVDGDEDLDILMAVRPQGAWKTIPAMPGQDRLYLNDGEGGFVDVTETHVPARNDSTLELAVGDIDGDGDVDVIGANPFDGPRGGAFLLVNDGTGRFADQTGSRLLPAAAKADHAELGDLDGDGDLDLVLGADYEEDTLYLNDGAGVFTDVSSSHLPAGVDGAAHLLVDVDGDGDLDLIFSGSDRSRSAALAVNDGSGTFALTTGMLPTADEWMVHWVAGDFDRDGDMDLAASGQDKDASGRFVGTRRIYANDGTGRFEIRASDPLPGVTPFPVSLTAGDIDEDGDLDLMGLITVPVGTFLEQNLDSQVHAPRLAGLGKPYPIDLYWQPGYARGEVLAIPLLADHGARIPLAGIGTLGLDPERLMVLPPIPIDPAVGQARLELAIPNVEALRERTLWVQALFLPGDAAPRLSNVLRDEIRF